MTQPVVKLENVDVALEGKTVLREITWRLLPGEHWAILGGNGSGKSTLLKLIRGELWPAPAGGGRRIYAFDGDEQTTAIGIKEKIALVSPELQSRYLQQEWKLTGSQVVHSGFQGGDYVYQKLTAPQQNFAREIIRLVGVDGLLMRNVQELSTGELRKILIARALAGSPRVLGCDEICDGLDSVSRASLLQTLECVARSGTQLLYITHRTEELLPAITHRLVLERGRMVECGGLTPLPIPEHLMSRRASAKPAVAATNTPGLASLARSKTLIQIQRADVFLGGKQVLHDINLEIRAGQHWTILGPNGAGKSTLLKLILGDAHPAFGGRVRRFTFSARNTLWEVKRRIGYVSPELQANYRESLTGAEVIAFGFFSSIGLRQQANPRQKRRVSEIVDWLCLHALAGKNVLRMSYGEVRRILLARALVHDPRLLLCDEPFDGLDPAARAEMIRTLEHVAQDGTSLIVVTHHANDLPACTTHVAELESGRLIFEGPMDLYLCRGK